MYIIMYCVNKENEKKKKKAHNKWNTAKDNILFCDCHVFLRKKKKRQIITSSENSFCLEPTTVYYRHENQIEY